MGSSEGERVSGVRQWFVGWAGGPIKTFLRWVQWQRTAMSNLDQPAPIYAPHAPKGLRVHLGSGEINLQGWVNVDARAFPHVHAQTSSLSLAEFADAAVGTVYLCHVLEHLSFEEGRTVLLALNRKLADGGTILISVPDFDALVAAYLASGRNFDSIKFALMGGQGYEYNFHRAMYTKQSLAALLAECGYGPAEPWVTEEEFGRSIGDWSSATVKAGEQGAIPLSVNLKARKLARE